MEEPYHIAILDTPVICEDEDTPATKVQSSLSLLGSSFVFIRRSPLGIIEVVESQLSTGEEERCGMHESKTGDIWLIAAVVDSSLITTQPFKQTKRGIVVTHKSQGGFH